MINTAIIILAAGNSSRYGKPKQLLHYHNKILLQHAVDEATASGAEPVVVVTGYNTEQITEALEKNNVQTVVNKKWNEGMAGAISLGVSKAITLNNNVEKIIITVCDQPFISASLFRQLFQQQQETVQHIIASAYANTIGTPALFTQKYFDALMSLKGDEGAKKILKTNAEDVATIDFPQGSIDIDTENDYKNLIDQQKHVL